MSILLISITITIKNLYRFSLLKALHTRYDNIPKLEKADYIMHNLLTQKIQKSLSTSYFSILNQRVCYYVWCLILKFNYHHVYKIYNKLLEKKYFMTVRPQYIPDATMKHIIISFLTEYFDIMAEWLPTGQKAIIPQFSKKDMYENIFVNHCKDKGVLIPSYSYFINVWLSYFKHIRMTNKQRFSICSTCQDFNDMINKVCFFY